MGEEMGLLKDYPYFPLLWRKIDIVIRVKQEGVIELDCSPIRSHQACEHIHERGFAAA